MPARIRRLGKWLLATILLASLVAACATLTTTRYRGPISDHFDGNKFHNLVPDVHRDLRQLMRWMWEREPGLWEVTANNSWSAPPPRVDNPDTLQVTFINHSTVLIQVAGINLLTDPIWSERASPLPFAGPKRFRDPGVPFHQLPPIDVVMVSHGHYDHMDLPTLKRLSDRDRPRILVPLGHARTLTRRKIDNVEELDWWDEVVIADGLRVIPVPVQHWTARGLFDRNLALWSGFVIEAPGGPIYFAGDTGYADHFRQAHDRFGAMRFALLPIGAYLPRWFMKPMHTSPADALLALEDLQAHSAMAVHFGTFQLGDDGQHEAASELATLRQGAGITDEAFWIPDFGEGRIIPALE